MKQVFILLACMLSIFYSSAQSRKTILFDHDTKEPLAGATIKAGDKILQSGNDGSFIIPEQASTIEISYSGYITRQLPVEQSVRSIYLKKSDNSLLEVFVTANKDAVRRSQAPISIASISAKTIQDTKATTVDQLLNKISGVNMINLGNEQHQMSIRQPMTTKSLFLYLEDGIPIRTTGLFNHNALLEMNQAATKSIEVIKGPSSSLYGSEAIGGVVNFITIAPSVVPTARLSAQLNDIGYKRLDLTSSFSTGKWGFALSGYYADKRNGYLEYTDYHKGIITARIDYRFSAKTTLVNSLTVLRYYSDMAGGIDSTMFARHSFSNPQTFTYRKVNGIRYRSALTHQWNDQAASSFTILYRDNAIGQNPAYRIKDDYRRQGAVYVGKKGLAHGEINESSFQSYSIIAQHKQHINWKQALFVGGINIDISPSTYTADYIKITKDTLQNKYTSYQRTDSALTNYATGLNNYASFVNFEFSPLHHLRVVASLRYDLFHYRFDNHLRPSSFSGAPDTSTRFQRISPKIGFTYNFNENAGLYANYSEGFVPPQVTELFTGVKVPGIQPAVFYNYEAGGWLALFNNRVKADVSVYHLSGTNEIISVKLDDGSFANQNAGKTSHRGVELGINVMPVNDLSFRISGAWSKHVFLRYNEKGIRYDGNQMNNAPNWVYNAELWYKPTWIKGFRIGIEMQHVGSYFADPQNTATYKGYTSLNIRTGYRMGNAEIWLNVLNATDNYYSYITTKSSFGYSYQLAEPRNFNAGITYDFGSLFNGKK